MTVQWACSRSGAAHRAEERLGAGASARADDDRGGGLGPLHQPGGGAGVRQVPVHDHVGELLGVAGERLRQEPFVLVRSWSSRCW